jgi:hypothetical protein
VAKLGAFHHGFNGLWHRARDDRAHRIDHGRWGELTHPEGFTPPARVAGGVT